MNQTKKSMPNSFTVTLPGANTENSQEARNLFDVRFSQKNKNLGKEQDNMPQRSNTVRQTMAQVKKSLGHRARTHYETMLKNPTAKLQAFIYPGMNVEQLKYLAKVLSTADPKQRTQLKKDATKKRQEAQESARQKKLMLADIERSGRRLARARKFEEPSKNTFIVGDLNDKIMGPNPKYCILTIMKKFAGKRIRIVAYSGTTGEEVRLLTKQVDKVSNTCMLVNVNVGEGPMVRDIYHQKDGEWRPSENAKPKRGDRTYSIPKEGINKFYRNSPIFSTGLFNIPSSG